MGIVQKIFYFHVPSAYAMYIGATACFLRLGRLPRAADRRARRLRARRRRGRRRLRRHRPHTGPLWGAKAWGTFWTWDPRLTTALLSVLIYVAYLVLRAFAGDGDGRAAVLGGARRPRRRQPAHHPLQRAEVGRPAPDGHHRQGRRPAAPGHEDRPRARASSLHAARGAAPLGARPRSSSRRAACARAEEDAIDLGLDTRTGEHERLRRPAALRERPVDAERPRDDVPGGPGRQPEHYSGETLLVGAYARPLGRSLSRGSPSCGASRAR